MFIYLARKTPVPTCATSLQNISKVTWKLCQNISNYFCNTTLGIFEVLLHYTKEKPQPISKDW
jgi:hypothetical protein